MTIPSSISLHRHICRSMKVIIQPSTSAPSASPGLPVDSCAPSFAPLQLFQDARIGTIDHHVTQRSQVDLCRALGVMAHALADDRQRDVLAAGYARPAVACHIHRQWGGQAELLGQGLQLTVHQVDGVQVLTTLIVAPTDDGQQVGRLVHWIFVQQCLHATLPADAEALPRLPAAVGEKTALQVIAAQVGHVDE